MERLPGFRDFYPEPLPHQDAWSADARQYIFSQWRKVARRYGFSEYDGPPLETLELYTTKSGEEIVTQLYNFNDKGGDKISLRPEMTPTLARMVSAHERHYKKPIKWFAIPQLFRYERQQKGRLREHFQLNADIFGESHCSADAELIALLIDSLRAFGLTSEDFVVRLSSRNAWHDFFISKARDSSKAYEFFQVVDKMEREDPAKTGAKLEEFGFTIEEVTQFIQAGKATDELDLVLKNLAARGLGDFARIDYGIIRGLAYYTGIVFEAFAKRGDCPRAIAGGGRYDNLVKVISGSKVNLPGLGFGMGDVVLRDLLNALGLMPKFQPRIDLYCLIEDETLRPESLLAIQLLRETGLSVDYSWVPLKGDKQFKKAMELSASHTVKVERQADGAIMVRHKNLKDRGETILRLADLAGHIKSIETPPRPE